MADTAIAVQPASNIPAATPVSISMETAVNEAGQTVMIQAVTIVAENGRPISLLTEQTGQDILQAIRALHATMAASVGDFVPATRGLSQS